MEIEGPNWGLINAEEISRMKIVKAIKKKIYGGWVCVNCVADVVWLGWGEKKGVWWLGLYELCHRHGCGWGGEQKVGAWLGLCELCRQRGSGKKKKNYWF